MKDTIVFFSNHITNTSINDFPEQTLTATKKFIIDTIGVGIFGSSGPWANQLIKSQDFPENNGIARVIGSRTRLDPTAAAPSAPAPSEPAEFASKHVRSNIAPILFIIQSEQLILQRTDQKAFTLMSLLGVFMVFFIVHFPKVIAADNFNYLSGLMVFLYFISATIGLISLMMVIIPRVRNDMAHEDLPDVNITFFGGITQFANVLDFAKYFAETTDDNENTFKMFSAQLYALGHINAYKNKHMRRAILFFGIAILSELIIIMLMTWGLTWTALFI